MSVNGTFIKTQRDAARKWLLLLSNSWTDMTLQYCWLITVISHSPCFTSNQFILNNTVVTINPYYALLYFLYNMTVSAH